VLDVITKRQKTCEKILFSRHDVIILEISCSSGFININKGSLMLNLNIILNLQHANVRDTLRLYSCPYYFKANEHLKYRLSYVLLFMLGFMVVMTSKKSSMRKYWCTRLPQALMGKLSSSNFEV
jgi:hypothetical protein